MTGSELFASRLSRFTRAMTHQGLDAFLIWDRANTRYLTGFQGSASLICLTTKDSYFLTDFRYVTIAKATVSNLRVVQIKPPEADHLARILKRRNVRKVGFEESVPYGLFKSWREKLGKTELVEATALIRRLREIKTANEVRKILKAQEIAENVLAGVLRECRPGVTEKYLARQVKRAIEDAGGDRPAFDPIVASGPNAALPHAKPGDRALKNGDFVIFDLGVLKDDYASDMTRTVVVGRASERQRRIYATALEAQRRAIARVRPGIAAKAVDQAARRWISAKGLAKYFGHGTGHGLGLDVHEPPRLGAQSTDTLRAGMVVTIEPGIYIPGWGGVRVEDMVLVRRKGRSVLTSFPKSLIEIH